jgi:2-methylcitrate dehydratase PrpD
MTRSAAASGPSERVGAPTGLSFSDALAGYCVGLQASDLSGGVVERLRLAVLDGMASMLAGVNEPVARQVLDYVLAAGCAGGCSIIGYQQRLRATDAALVNGTVAHACDYDDSSWTMWGHPTAPLLPAVLAAAEEHDASGSEVLVAFLAGLEVEKSLGIAMQPEHYRRGWHPTATLGLFGAVAGAGKILGLARGEFAQAFGLAASMTAGLRCNAGYGTKPLHTGFAARGGLEAATLARAGVTANPFAFEGNGGIFELYGQRHVDLETDALKRLGNPFEVEAPGLSPKLYPCCSDIHCAIDAVFDLRHRHGFTPAQILAIRCHVAPIAEPNVRRRDPKTPTEAKFSLNYCVASAVIRDDVSLGRFTDTALADPAVRAFMERVTAIADPLLAPGGTDSFSSPALVEIDLADGSTLQMHLREMRGHPDRPLVVSDYVAKFRQCAQPVLDRTHAEELAEALGRLESLPSIRGIMRLAAGDRLAGGAQQMA